MIVLSIDTCLDACAAAVWADGWTLAARSEPMRRGHQERLGALVSELMDEAGIGFAALDRIGVTVGPGSFTGLRVGLAFAKGLGLALARPVVGIGVLEALAAGEPEDLVAAVVGGPRAQVYLQIFAGGRSLMSPDCLPIETAAARLAEFASGQGVALVGPGAADLAQAAPRARVAARAAPDPAMIARLAAAATAQTGMPRPLYLRPPDARQTNP